MSKPSVLAVALRLAPSMKSAILLEEGDIQFLAFVVGKCFLARRQRTVQFMKSCLGPAVDYSDTRYRKFGDVGATKVYLWWRNKAFSCPKAATCGFTDSPVRPGRRSRGICGAQITNWVLRKAAPPYNYPRYQHIKPPHNPNERSDMRWRASPWKTVSTRSTTGLTWFC